MIHRNISPPPLRHNIESLSELLSGSYLALRLFLIFPNIQFIFHPNCCQRLSIFQPNFTQLVSNSPNFLPFFLSFSFYTLSLLYILSPSCKTKLRFQTFSEEINKSLLEPLEKKKKHKISLKRSVYRSCFACLHFIDSALCSNHFLIDLPVYRHWV